MSFLHDSSCECVKSELDLFSVPPTQVSVESAIVQEFQPLAALTHLLPVEFCVLGSGQEYIDLANMQLYVRAKITRANGTNIDDTDIVAPVNLTLHSLFSEVDLKLNDTTVTSNNNTYAYRAYLETLLSYGLDAKDSQLTCSLYYKDSSRHMDVAEVAGAGATNEGLVTRYGYFQGSRICDMMGRLHLDLCFQERLVPSDVGLRLRLVRNKDAFCLMAAGQAPAYRLQITDCKLYVRKVRLSPSVYVAHGKALEISNAKFPIERIVCKTFTVPMGNLDFSQENIFSGQLPTRLVVAMCDNDAFNGSYAKNPFNFKHYTLSQLKLYLDGQPQSIIPLDTDFANGQYLRAYLSLFESTGKLGKDEGIDITRSDYGHGYTIFGWDLTPDASERDHVNLIREGTVRLDAKFATPLPNCINVLVYAEFDSIVEIDRHRNVLIDFGS